MSSCRIFYGIIFEYLVHMIKEKPLVFMKYFSMIAFVLVLVSCSAPRVVYDYDEKTDFSQFKTYNYFPELKTNLSELDEKRLLAKTDSILNARGYEKSNTPDFYINMKAHAIQSQRSTVGVGVGGGGRNVGGGISIGLPVGSSANQEIVIDFVNVQRDELFWQAIAEGKYKENASPEKKEEYFKTVLLKVLEKYPPNK